MGPYGPEAQAGLGISSEHFPCKETAVLAGHEGPVLVVRFNRQGTYCLSGGKVRGCGEYYRKITLFFPCRWRALKLFCSSSGPHHPVMESSQRSSNKIVLWSRIRSQGRCCL